MRLEKRASSSTAALVLAPIGAVVFTLLVSSVLVWWAGAAVDRNLWPAAQGRLRFGVCAQRNPDPRHPADPHRAGRHGGVQGAAVQHRRRGPALCRRAGGRGGRRHARRHRVRPAADAAVRADAAGQRAGRRPAAAGPGAAEGTPGRGRGGHHAAAELHRAAVRLDDARRTDEGPDRHGLAAERGPAGRSGTVQADRPDAGPQRPGRRLRAGRAGVGPAEVHRVRLRHPRRRRQCPCRRIRRRAGDPHRGAGGDAVRRTGRAWPARSKWPAAPATSRSTCRRAMATPAS